MLGEPVVACLQGGVDLAAVDVLLGIGGEGVVDDGEGDEGAIYDVDAAEEGFAFGVFERVGEGEGGRWGAATADREGGHGGRRGRGKGGGQVEGGRRRGRGGEEGHCGLQL